MFIVADQIGVCLKSDNVAHGFIRSCSCQGDDFVLFHTVSSFIYRKKLELQILIVLNFLT